MSKKEKVEEPKTESEEVTTQIENDEDGLGIEDPKEVLAQFGATPEETEAVEPPEEEPEEEEEESESDEEPESEEPDEEPEEEEESEEDAEEPEESEEETEEEEESQEEPEKVNEELSKAQDEIETWKKRYSDSQREVQTKFIPMSKELETARADNEKLVKEREEISQVLRSNPELLESFVSAANNPELAKAEPAKPSLDKETIAEAVKETLGEDTLQTLNQMKQEKVDARVKVIDDFEAEHPGLTDEDRYQIAQMAGSIEAIRKAGLKEALDSAYLALFPDKAIAGQKEQLEKAAKISAIKNKEATSSRTTSGSSKEKKVKLSAQEKVTARKLGMSAEEYLEHKTNS